MNNVYVFAYIFSLPHPRGWCFCFGDPHDDDDNDDEDDGGKDDDDDGDLHLPS